MYIVSGRTLVGRYTDWRKMRGMSNVKFTVNYLKFIDIRTYITEGEDRQTISSDNFYFFIPYF